MRTRGRSFRPWSLRLRRRRISPRENRAPTCADCGKISSCWRDPLSDLPNIVLDTASWHFRSPFGSSFGIDGDGGYGAIRRSNDIGTKDEVSRGVESLARAQKRSPPGTSSVPISQECRHYSPVFHIRTSRQSMANYHNIIMRLIHLSPCLIRDRYIVQDIPGFECEFRNDRGCLLNQRCIA